MESIYSKIAEAENNRINLIICTIVKSEGSTPRKTGTKMLVYTDKTIYGTIGGGALEQQVINDAIEFLKNKISQVKHYALMTDLKMCCGGTVDIYFEPIIQKSKLYIFGAGHVGKALARLSLALNFDVRLIDDRPAIFDDIRDLPLTNISLDGQNAIKQINFDENPFICILTSSHEIDFQLTTTCALKNFSYLGLIGSERKFAKFKKNWLEQKLLTEEQICGIDCPMGVKINCETPDEIAVSILAKLVDVRNKK